MGARRHAMACSLASYRTGKPFPKMGALLTPAPADVSRAQSGRASPMISKDTISLVRDRTDIVAVISDSVPTLKRRGRRFVGLCPFHKEKTPSFHVNPETGRYHCFGCKESGDAFTFLERIEGYSFIEAVRALAERAGIPI